MTQQTIAILGGTGFIGRAVVTALARNPAYTLRVLVHRRTPDWLISLPRVERVFGDLRSPVILADVVAGASVVLNLAGQVSPEVADYQRVNLEGMVSVGRVCQETRVPRVVHVSSSLVYGTVSRATEQSPCRPISPYATLKLAAEQILEAQLRGTSRLACLRLTNVYGPAQHAGVVAYLYDLIRRRAPLAIDADGAQVRDFLYLDEAADAIVRALQMPVEGPINIGSGHPTSILQLVRLLEQSLDLQVTGQYRPEQTGGERENTVDVTRARDVLGWQARVGLATGLDLVAHATPATLRKMSEVA